MLHVGMALSYITVTGVITTNSPLKLVPMRFVTIKEYMFSDSSPQVFQANLDCDKFHGINVDVCAELPYNWKWNTFQGYVYLNIFNNSADTKTVSAILISDSILMIILEY